MNSDEIKFLLKKVRNILVPKCVNIGEQLTYVAYKEKLIDEILAKIDGQQTHDESFREIISINQQKLAENVISRTFDSHSQILRLKVKRAEAERDKWMKLALQKIPNANELVLSMDDRQMERSTMNSSTQTEEVNEENGERERVDVTFESKDRESIAEIYENLLVLQASQLEWCENALNAFVAHSSLRIHELCALGVPHSFSEEDNSRRTKTKKKTYRRTSSGLPQLFSNKNLIKTTEERKEVNNCEHDDPQGDTRLYVIKSMLLTERGKQKSIQSSV